MEHIGIDLGGRESQVCVRDGNGGVVAEAKVPTAELGEFLKRRPSARVVLETCAEAFAVADAARQAAHEVRVVPATLVRALGVGARGVKTDVRDARLLSETSCRMEVPSVHVPSVTARELKAQLTARDTLLASRTQLINSVRGLLRTQLVRVRSGGVETFPRRVRTRMLETKAGVAVYLERQLKAIESLNEQIKGADAELGLLAEADAICRLLMTAPGVGPVTAARFKSAVDVIERFGGAHALESYLGLVPGESSSSERQRRTGITKAGASAVRRCLVQASWVAWLRRPDDPLVQWARGVAQRRGRQVAICALGRKLAGVLYAIWRHQRAYNPMRLRVESGGRAA